MLNVPSAKLQVIIGCRDRTERATKRGLYGERDEMCGFCIGWSKTRRKEPEAKTAAKLYFRRVALCFSPAVREFV